MGDMLSLIERAEQQLDEKKAEELVKKLETESFDFNDMLEQFKQIRKMGSLKQIMSMLPGMEKQIRDVEIDDRQIDRTMAIILSMTEAERKKPSLLNASRKRRIAAGCGMKVEDVNRLVKQFEQMRMVMKQFGGKGGKKRRRMPFNPKMMPPGGFPGM